MMIETNNEDCEYIFDENEFSSEYISEWCINCGEEMIYHIETSIYDRQYTCNKCMTSKKSHSICNQNKYGKCSQCSSLILTNMIFLCMTCDEMKCYKCMEKIDPLSTQESQPINLYGLTGICSNCYVKCDVRKCSELIDNKGFVCCICDKISSYCYEHSSKIKNCNIQNCTSKFCHKCINSKPQLKYCGEHAPTCNYCGIYSYEELKICKSRECKRSYCSKCRNKNFNIITFQGSSKYCNDHYQVCPYYHNGYPAKHIFLNCRICKEETCATCSGFPGLCKNHQSTCVSCSKIYPLNKGMYIELWDTTLCNQCSKRIIKRFIILLINRAVIENNIECFIPSEIYNNIFYFMIHCSDNFYQSRKIDNFIEDSL